MSEDLDISNSKVGISLVNSSIVPESPCIKIVDIVDVANDEELFLTSDLLPQLVAPTSNTLKYLFFCPRHNFYIQIWDVHACQLVSTIDMEYNYVSVPRGRAVTNDGNTFLCARGPGDYGISSVDIWDIRSSTFIRKLEMNGVFSPFLYISPDSRRLAVSEGRRVHVYDLHTGIMLSSHTLARYPGPIIIGWSPNSDRLLTCEIPDDDPKRRIANVTIWQTTDNAVEPVIDPIRLNCTHLTLSSHILFSGDKIIYVYRGELLIEHLDNGHFQVRVPRYHLGEYMLGPCALSPDGQVFACTARDYSCVIVDATSGSIIGGPLWGGCGLISSLYFAANGGQLVCLSNCAGIRVWDVKAALEQYRPVYLQKEANASPAPNAVAPSTSTFAAPRNVPRARSNSVGSSILNLPIADVPTPSVTLLTLTPTQTPYTRRREGRKPIEFDSLLDIPRSVHVLPLMLLGLHQRRRSGNPPEAAAITPSAPGHSQRRARLTTLWARIRRRRKPGPTLEQGSRARRNKSRSESIPMRDLSDAPVLPSAPAPTDDSGIVEVAAGRLDDRLIIALPRKKKKKLPASPPLQAAENAEVQPASQSNASSSVSSSSLTDSDAESIDWLDYICFCMCLPCNKSKKKKRKEKLKRKEGDRL
ncbi:Quino protein amine dehydrogenase [Hygrophoropsis aurantiaca]|uniref:Quino protein amine dehydrogenase n=1 Tax=Hygrophoropsis aurantiaca TaxID=72124 RepID=A0ACB8AFD9_9AGAM|nr:Quino protein amine dehydrogenase [Hygrophoropsis aurantiaca]